MNIQTYVDKYSRINSRVNHTPNLQHPKIYASYYWFVSIVAFVHIYVGRLDLILEGSCALKETAQFMVRLFLIGDYPSHVIFFIFNRKISVSTNQLARDKIAGMPEEIFRGNPVYSFGIHFCLDHVRLRLAD